MGIADTAAVAESDSHIPAETFVVVEVAGWSGRRGLSVLAVGSDGYGTQKLIDNYEEIPQKVTELQDSDRALVNRLQSIVEDTDYSGNSC